MATFNPSSAHSDWKFWGLWMLASIAAVIVAALVVTPLSVLLVRPFAPEPSLDGDIPVWFGVIVGLLGTGIFGAAIGVGQWLVLRRSLNRSAGWILATLLGYLLLVLPVSLPFGALFGYTPQTTRIMGGIAFAVTGLGMGIFQWLVLRGRVRRAGWWVALTVAAWVSAYLLTGLFIIGGLYVEPLDMLLAFLVPVAVAGAGLTVMLKMKEPAGE